MGNNRREISLGGTSQFHGHFSNKILNKLSVHQEEITIYSEFCSRNGYGTDSKLPFLSDVACCSYLSASDSFTLNLLFYFICYIFDLYFFLSCITFHFRLRLVKRFFFLVLVVSYYCLLYLFHFSWEYRNHVISAGFGEKLPPRIGHLKTNVHSAPKSYITISLVVKLVLDENAQVGINITSWLYTLY